MGRQSVVAVLALFALSSCEAQIFPFSNLKHFFDHKAKSGPGAGGFFRNHPVLAESESEVRARQVPPPTGPTGPPEPTAAASLPPTPTTTDGLPLLEFPHFDPEDGFREFRKPDPPLPPSKPKTKAAAKSRLPQETHQYPAYYLDGASNAVTDPKKRSPLHIPLGIAYETVPLVSVSTVNVNYSSRVGPGGPGVPAERTPADFLTPPRLPSADSASSASSPSATNVDHFKTASTNYPLPPVPSFFLQAPPPPSDLDFFSFNNNESNSVPIEVAPPQAGLLDLSDVAQATVSNSQNPTKVKGIYKFPGKVTDVPLSNEISPNKMPSNHKFIAHSYNNSDVLSVAKNHRPDDFLTGQSNEKELVDLSNHQMDNTVLSVLSNNKLESPSGAPTNHKLETSDDVPANHKPLSNGETPPVVDSSPTETAALGAYGGPHTHKPPPKAPRPPPYKLPFQPHHQKPHTPSHHPPNHKPHKVPKPHPRHKYPSNHQDQLLVEESMGAARYRKHRPPANHVEQEVAASGIHSGSYPGAPPSSDGDRIEFQMHGMQGPKSYKFGYDTGKGHNRQFRYEERDPHGNVKGHYGYVDENGKLQVVNYQADPEHGFSADVSKLQL